VTSSHKASVLARASSGRLEIAVSDPTQANPGSIVVEVSRAATGVLVADPAITVQQLSPTTRLSVNVAGSAGRTFSITLSTPAPVVSITATTPTAHEHGTVAGQFTVASEQPVEFPITISLPRTGTATPNTDYTAPPSVTLGAGETMKTIAVTPVNDGVAEGPETVSLSIPPGDGYSIGASPSATVTILDAPFDQWRFDHNLPNISATDDTDGDGMVSLLEYALATDPEKALSPDWPQVSLSNQRLAIAFRRNTQAIDAVIKVQAANSATGPWQDLASSVNGAPFSSLAGPNVLISEQGAGPERNVTVTDSVDAGPAGEPKRFLRVQVSR
jgi:hypothetical protein